MRYRPTEDRAIVRRDPAETETKGGIVLPDVAQRTLSSGTVLEVGPGALNERAPVRPCGGCHGLGRVVETAISEGAEDRHEATPEAECPLCAGAGIRPPPRLPMPVRAGDRVIFGRYAGAEIEIPTADGEKIELTLLRASEVALVLDEEDGDDVAPGAYIVEREDP